MADDDHGEYESNDLVLLLGLIALLIKLNPMTAKPSDPGGDEPWA